MSRCATPSGARLAADLGDARYLILRNHGLLTCGRNAAEAFQAMYTLESACRIQILAQSGGGRLIEVPAAITGEMPAQSREVTQGQGADLVWPGLLRRLDRRLPGYDALIGPPPMAILVHSHPLPGATFAEPLRRLAPRRRRLHRCRHRACR